LQSFRNTIRHVYLSFYVLNHLFTPIFRPVASYAQNLGKLSLPRDKHQVQLAAQPEETVLNLVKLGW